MCWRRLLRVPWTAWRSNQAVAKKINPEYSLTGLMLKPKPQHFGCLMWRADSLEKTPLLGKTEGKRRRGWQRMRRLDSITDSVDMNLNKLWEIVEERSLMCYSPRGQRVRYEFMTEQQHQSFYVHCGTKVTQTVTHFFAVVWTWTSHLSSIPI